jgi:two-component system phosphate regulon response regulator OmpR
MRHAHVMVVDDEESLRDLLTQSLEERGRIVTTAESGTIALQILAAVRPDVVLLDVRMEGLDGLETLRHIVTQHPTLPVVMLTSNGDRDAVALALDIGARDYVAKSMLDDLEEVLSLHLPGAGMSTA